MRRLPATLLEACLVVVGGVGLGLVVNAGSDDGLDLGRDYFPRLATVEPAPVDEPPAQPLDESTSDETPPSDAAGSEPTPDTAGSNGSDVAPTEAAGSAADEERFAPAHVVARLAEHGLQPMSFAEARATFEDPMYEFGAWVFVDAREPEPYAAGHIPGAYLFDRYRPEKYINDILPLLGSCERVVVYCNGGECDDSEFAAANLMQFGAQPGQIWVYVGGIEQWRHEGLPLETGARGSGALLGGGAEGDG